VQYSTQQPTKTNGNMIKGDTKLQNTYIPKEFQTQELKDNINLIHTVMYMMKFQHQWVQFQQVKEK
jgi:hypothetical protein